MREKKTELSQSQYVDKWLSLDVVLSMLHQGAYDDIIHRARSTKRPVSAQMDALVSLCEALRWLDSQTIAATCPISALALTKTLKDSGLPSQIGMFADIAIARLHLIEGNAGEALNKLQSNQLWKQASPRGYYYLAWASALTGDHIGVETCLLAYRWSGRWPIACLLFEVDPEAGRPMGLWAKNAHERAAVPEAYVSAFQFRLALVWSTIPEQVKWTPGAGSFEEDMEGLRSALGYAFYTADVPGMSRAMDMPLFQRLPLADQTTWKGLLAVLSGDKKQGYTLLEKAAKDLGARRAARILSVLLLEEGQLANAQEMLQIATFNPDEFKLNLLLAHIQMREGNMQAAEQILEKFARRGKAQYALGNMYLFQAEEALRRGSLVQAQSYYKQATQAFGKSKVREETALPVVSSRRARYAKDMAAAARQSLVQLQQKQSSVLFSDNGRQLQESWEELLTRLGSEKPALVATACEDLLELLSEMSSIKPDTLEIIARVTAYQCTRAERLEQVEKMVDLLNYLAVRSELAPIKELRQQSITTVNLLRYRRTGEQQREVTYQRIIQQTRQDVNNFTLALLAAYASVQHHQQEQAVALLSTTKPGSPLEQDVQALLIELLSGPHPSAGRLLQSGSKEDAPVALVQASALLKAVTTIVTGRLDQEYEALLTVVQKEASSLASVIDPYRLILVLCTYQREGRVFVPFLDAALHLSKYLQDNKVALMLARYLAARGEVKHACAWWERVLTVTTISQSVLRQEAAGFLCHRAVQDQQAGDYARAVAMLRQAARFLTGEQHA